MIFINEWLPNPTGNDAVGEWVELFNGGKSAVLINGWSLKNGSGKKVFLKNERIDAGEHLVLKRTNTKLTLRNTDETLFLYDGAGKLADQSGFLGTAPEGKSFARIAGVGSPNGAQNFLFAEPTQGQPNKIVNGQNFLTNNVYSFNQPLNSSLGYFGVIALTICSALLLTFFITIILKRNDYTSKLFFNRD